MDNKTFSHQYSEALVEAAFAKLGYFVYTNKSGKASSDIIVEDEEGFLLKVEVKSSYSIKENTVGRYIEVALRSIRSNKTSNTSHSFDNKNIDILAIVCTDTSQLILLDAKTVDNKSTITIYLEDMATIASISTIDSKSKYSK